MGKKPFSYKEHWGQVIYRVPRDLVRITKVWRRLPVQRVVRTGPEPRR